MIKKITLTATDHFFAMRSGTNKQDLISFNIASNSVFDGATLKEEKAYNIGENDIGSDSKTLNVNGAGTPILILLPQGITRGVVSKNMWYIFTVQNANANTVINIYFEELNAFGTSFYKHTDGLIVENYE